MKVLAVFGKILGTIIAFPCCIVLGLIVGPFLIGGTVFMDIWGGE